MSSTNKQHLHVRALCEGALMVALAQALSEVFADGMELFYRQGFAAIRREYLARCANLGRHVNFDGGEGRAVDVDEAGRLVVKTEAGTQAVFTGEVTVQGIYGAE